MYELSGRAGGQVEPLVMGRRGDGWVELDGQERPHAGADERPDDRSRRTALHQTDICPSMFGMEGQAIRMQRVVSLDAHAPMKHTSPRLPSPIARPRGLRREDGSDEAQAPYLSGN